MLKKLMIIYFSGTFSYGFFLKKGVIKLKFLNGIWTTNPFHFIYKNK